MQTGVGEDNVSESLRTRIKRDGRQAICGAAWPSGIDIGADPVRRVHTRGRRRNTSLIYSTLPLGMRVSESQCETRFLKVVQLEPRATIVRAQPTRLAVLEDSRVRPRIPDFAVMIDGRAEIHEIKQDAECWKVEVRSELLAIRDEVERDPGWHYSVTLETALLAEPLRSNTDMLWRELVPAEEIDLDLRLRTLSLLDDGPITAANLIERTATSQRHGNGFGSWTNLLAMIAGGHVEFDVDELLTPNSIVWSRNSGPRRKRTLPFGTVEDAIRLPLPSFRPTAFCSLSTRRMPE